MTLFIPLAPMSMWQDNELRYALRSWQKHSPPDEVVIAGYKPGWLINVTHLPTTFAVSKPKDIYLKAKLAAEYTQEFIFANDDHFLLQPYVENYGHSGPLAAFRGGSDTFQRYVANTSQLFPNGLYFDVHTPMTMVSDIVKRLQYPKDCLLKSNYANTAGVTGTQIQDCKINSRLKYEDIQKRVEGLPLFSIGDAALGPDMRRFLHDLYPEPSIYENLEMSGKVVY